MKKIWKYILIALMMFLNWQSVLAQENKTIVNYWYARVLNVQDTENEINGEKQSMQKVEIEMLDGEKKGEKLQFDNNPSAYEDNDRYLRTGDKIVISYQVVGDEAKIAFSDFVRTGQIGFLILIFVVLLLAISGFKGIRSIISFGWVLLNIIYFIRGVLAGNNVYLLVLVMAISIVVGSSIILVGWNRKMWLVVLSSLFGLLISTILVLGVGRWAHFSEIGLEDANLFHLSGALKDLDYVGIVYAGMIIGALGSMMDITISIVAGVEETISMIKEKKVRRFEKKELFESGLNIGREIMVVNANTLILAYAGSSITIWLIAISQGYSGGLLWNFNTIFVEVLRILAGTIGIFATIPIAAWLSSRMMIFERSYSFESEER